MSASFSIKDLENVCGVKAHTIRIWEKRYHLLSPERTDTNIRTYNMDSLKKLLNVSFLVNCGYKISRVAKLTPDEINEYLNTIISDKTIIDKSFNNLKVAMLNYNTTIFNTTVNEALSRYSLNEVFFNIFIPFLNEIGLLWQSGTINSTHEHFITNLIKQKLWSNINNIQTYEADNKKTFVLFLPQGEISDLSIIFLNNLLLSNGYRTIYLGSNISKEELEGIAKLHNNLVFTSYFTVAPNTDDVLGYLNEFNDQISAPNNHEFWVMGRILTDILVPTDIKHIQSFKDFQKIIA